MSARVGSSGQAAAGEALGAGEAIAVLSRGTRARARMSARSTTANRSPLMTTESQTIVGSDQQPTVNKSDDHKPDPRSSCHEPYDAHPPAVFHRLEGTHPSVTGRLRSDLGAILRPERRSLSRSCCGAPRTVRVIPSDLDSTRDLAPESELWRRLLLGTDPSVARLRRRHRRIPSPPRCKMCAAPFGPPGGWVLRHFGHARWAKNPKYCEGCFRTLQANHGGAEVECSLLFADIRGSTSIAERMRPTEFRALMGRFYDKSFSVLIDYNAIVDKFVGDEVIAIFVPAYTGQEHARNALDAADRLLEVTGHGRSRRAVDPHRDRGQQRHRVRRLCGAGA